MKQTWATLSLMKRVDSPHAVVGALLEAYRAGAFPMADPQTGEVAFYQAPYRGIFPITACDPAGAFHVPRSLRRRLNAGWLQVRADTAFVQICRQCSAPRPDDPESWINDTIIDWFTLLHQEGFAHSVEAWRRDPDLGEDHLVGGVYGLAIGGAFMGESMFSRPMPRLPDGRRHPMDGANASKICLVHLVEHLRQRGFVLFDTQLVNPHIAQLGCVEISHDQYMFRLAKAVELPVKWGEFASRSHQ